MTAHEGAWPTEAVAELRADVGQGPLTRTPVERREPPLRPASGVAGGFRPERRVRAAAWAVFTVFAFNGFVFASWVSRLPAVRAQLDLSATEMGLILLVAAAGALVALPLSGAVVARVGSANATRFAAIACASGLTSAAVAVGAGSTPHVAISSFAAAMGVGAWDVSMNIQGAVVEHSYRRAMLPRFHAGFSLGAVVGAGTGALAAAFGIAVTPQVVATSVCAAVVVVVVVVAFLPDGGAGLGVPTSGAAQSAPVNAFAPWREPRTLLIGLVVLAAGLSEGGANDWLALAVVDSLGATESHGALAFAVFVLAMTVMRLVGSRLLDRFGRVPVLRASSVLALGGLLVFVLAPSLELAMTGAVAWGLGSALGFPVGMSAASDDPRLAAMRVSVVSSIGYLAFLAGPPLLGLLADRIGYRPALLVIAGPVALGLVVAFAAAPLPDSERGPEPEAPG
jgi:MFS family permease